MGKGTDLMQISSKWNRRGFLGTAAAIAASVFAPRKLFSMGRAAQTTTTSVSGFGQTGDPYEELGVTTVINCEGTMTMLGGIHSPARTRSGDGDGRKTLREHS